ncbi:BTAD domain-containing putative transcriptional regulator [Nocardia sp. NPDC050717]|uniref:BTAD domain-containing putative transcriptional regulator n=1 Tax=Nocardia sp. NPDC050717 TaxID=3157221 RepID=UPI0033C45021
MGERPADLGGPRQRALLARLVLAGGEVVSTDRLIEDLWAGDPPPKALGALQAHISYLRRAIEPARPPRAPATVLVSEAPGYALRLDPAAVDVWRFERLLTAGDPDDPAHRYQRLGTALACWHGEPYAPFATAHWVLAEAARLHELRRVAVEGRAEAALALDRPDEAFALLHRHVTDHPDRENAARLLALTQYRLGRQLDALATLRALRTYLDTEFGVHPSPAVNALETAILTHAPELDQRAGSHLADPAPGRFAGGSGSVRALPRAGGGPISDDRMDAGVPGGDRPMDGDGRFAGPRVGGTGSAQTLPGEGGGSASYDSAEAAGPGADRLAGGTGHGADRRTSGAGSVRALSGAGGGSTSDDRMDAGVPGGDRPMDGDGRFAGRRVGGNGRFPGGAEAEPPVRVPGSAEVTPVSEGSDSGTEVDLGGGQGWPGARIGSAGPAVGISLERTWTSEPAVVGYAAERTALLAESAAVISHGRARVVWLEGEAGAGKSTQVEVLAATLAADGWSVASASCPEVDGAPAAWAWVHLLDGLDPTWVSAVGEDQAPATAEGVGAQAGPFAIARAVAEVCGRCSAGGPLLVVLEDVHRADSATLQILRQVVAWLTRRPLLVLVTMRGSEADAGVRATAAALAGSTGLRLELGGLDGAAVRAVAERAGLTPIDDDTVEWLRARTAGNPLFVREVATLAAAVGDLRAVPEGVRAVLHRRIARLPAGAARALRLAAVWGDDIDFDTLLALTAEPEDTLVDLVDTVTVAGLVRVDTDRITFAHALIRDAVYGDIPTLRRARLHWSALELLERRVLGPGAPLVPAATGPGPDPVAARAHNVDSTATGSTRSAAAAPDSDPLAAARTDRADGAASGTGGAGGPAWAAGESAGAGRVSGSAWADRADGAASGTGGAGGPAWAAGESAGAGRVSGSAWADRADGAASGTGGAGGPAWAAGESAGTGRVSGSTWAHRDAGTGSASDPTSVAPADALATLDTVILDAMAHHAIAGAGSATATRALRYVLAAARRRTARRAHQDAEPLWRAALELHARAGHDSASAVRADRLAALATRCALINALAYGGSDEQARRLRAETLTMARALMPTDRTAGPSDRGDTRASHGNAAGADAARSGHREGAASDGARTGDDRAAGDADAFTTHREGAASDGARTGDDRAAGRADAPTTHREGAAASDGDRTGHDHAAGDHDALTTHPAAEEAAPGRLRSAVPDPGQAFDPRIDEDPVVAVLTCWRAPTFWTSRDRGLPDADMAADLASALERTTAPDLRVRLLVTTVFAVEGFDNPRAFASSVEAVRTARELGDAELLCAALNARAFVALGPDLWQERAGLTEELLRVATAAGLPEYQAVGHFLRFLVASGAGRLVDARSAIAEALDCAEGGQLGPLLVVSTAHLAVLAVLRGDLATAEAIDTDLSAKMIAAGNANGAQLVLLAQMMTGWARGDLAPGLDGYAQLYAVAPHAISYVYALALLDAGDTERAATVLDAGTEVLRDYYWGAMSAFEARVVARIGTAEAAERLYRDLLPRAGTIAGMDSGSVAFGPVDTVLAELADRLGDHAAATRHRAAAERVLADLATELAALDETGAPLT